MIIAKKWLQNFNYLPDAFVVEGPEAGGHLGFSKSDLDEKKHNDEKKHLDIPIGRILIDKGFISENELIELLSLQKNIDKLLEESYSELERLKDDSKDS